MNEDINHSCIGKCCHIEEDIEYLHMIDDYLKFLFIYRNMKIFYGFLRVDIAWFLILMEFCERMNVEFSAGYIFDEFLIDSCPTRENIVGSIKENKIILTLMNEC